MPGGRGGPSRPLLADPAKVTFQFSEKYNFRSCTTARARSPRQFTSAEDNWRGNWKLGKMLRPVGGLNLEEIEDKSSEAGRERSSISKWYVSTMCHATLPPFFASFAPPATCSFYFGIERDSWTLASRVYSGRALRRFVHRRDVRKLAARAMRHG